MMTTKPDLTIVIPALNEENRLGGTLRELRKFLKADSTLKNVTTEVIVVAADAVDRTHEVAVKEGKGFHNFRLLKPGPKLGKGRDVQYGMLQAKGRWVLFMDADLATPLRHVARFYRRTLKGGSHQADIFIATRNLRKHHKNYFRRLLSNCGNLLYRILGGVWVEDSQCGFKMFSAPAAKTCFSRQTINGWGFDMEVLAIARQNKYKISALRVNDWRHVPDGPFERGDVGKMLDSTLSSLKDLLVIFKNRLSGKYLK